MNSQIRENEGMSPQEFRKDTKKAPREKPGPGPEAKRVPNDPGYEEAKDHEGMYVSEAAETKHELDQHVKEKPGAKGKGRVARRS